MIYTHGQYSCLVYNPASIRETPPAKYDFLPDDISWDETRAYARWTNEVLRGEWGGATLESFSPFLTSRVPDRPLWIRDRLGVVVLAAMASLPGSDVRTAFLWADLLFPAGAATALILLCWRLRPSLSFAVAGASLVMFFNWQDLLNLLAFVRGAPQNESIFLRTPYPQFSTIVLCAFLICVLRLVELPSLPRVVLYVLALDLNFLTYFYSWTYCLSLACATAIVVILARVLPIRVETGAAQQNRRALTALVIGTAVGFLLAFPVWKGMLQHDPAANDDFLRLGGALGRTPEIKYSAGLLFCLAALLLWKSRTWKTKWFASAFLIGSVLVMNIQILTGKTIQPAHWTNYYIQPLILIFLLDLLWRHSWLERPAFRNAIAVGLLTTGVLINLCKFSIGAKQSVEFNRRNTEFEQVVKLLHQPALLHDGFLTNDAYLSAVLPAFIEQKPLLSWYMDPQSNWELASLQRAAAGALRGEPEVRPELLPIAALASSVTPAHDSALCLRYDKIIFVLNRHRTISEKLFSDRTIALSNRDFIVLTPP